MEERVLTKEFVAEVLSEVSAKESIIDPTYQVSSGAGKGEGYLSFITRVDIKGKNKELPVIIKHAPKSEKMREMLPIDKVFSTEIKFYTKTMPVFEQFQKEKNVKFPFNVVPKCYKTVGIKKQELIVLENIKENGFTVYEKTKQMDDSHVQLVLREYGKFHAVSFAMQDQDEETFVRLTNDMINPFSPEDIKSRFVNMHVCGIEKIMSLFDKTAESGVYNALARLKDSILELMIFLNTHHGDYSVIVHGDCWCNNMMFKYKAGSSKPSELCIFDFQICNFRTPVFDIIYFFYVSASQEMLDNLDTYLKIYYDSLRAHLSSMGSDVDKLFPFSAFQQDWKLYAKFGLIIATVVFRIMLRDEDETLDFSDTSNSNKSVADTFMLKSKNEDMINERYRRLALHLYDRGFL